MTMKTSATASATASASSSSSKFQSGKHAGKTLKWVFENDKGYFEWMCKNYGMGYRNQFGQYGSINLGIKSKKAVAEFLALKQRLEDSKVEKNRSENTSEFVGVVGEQLQNLTVRAYRTQRVDETNPNDVTSYQRLNNQITLSIWYIDESGNKYKTTRSFTMNILHMMRDEAEAKVKATLSKYTKGTVTLKKAKVTGHQELYGHKFTFLTRVMAA